MIDYIANRVPREELLCQLAEEAAELGQAALKLRRTMGDQNPTPVSYDEALERLHEEIADVKLVLKCLGMDSAYDRGRHLSIMQGKIGRWVRRLRGEENA